MKHFRLPLTAALLALGMGTAQAAAEPTVIHLNQVGCQFLESEHDINRGYTPMTADDCRKINADTGDKRLAEAKVLNLKPGRYVFRVSNQNVPYELGFWLRGDGLAARALLPSVSGGGLVTGKTQDYEIELKAGEYVYSCPLNPTPDYKLVVR
ncbi:hypothetical protein [Denitromonas ohlonensis]|jgi:hypothetical protein|nr:hypothetical protein [Denitromonas ohlonensis]